MKTARILVLATALAVSAPAPSPACSLAAGYLPPSNFELVRDAHAIVLVKSVKRTATERGSDRFTCDVVQVLKGTVAEKTLELGGSGEWQGSGKPEDFSGPRRGAYSGACNAYDYKVDTFFLLIGDVYGALFAPHGPPFTRINEDISGADAPWVKAVTHYVRIAALATADLQKKALRDLAEQTENPVPGLAADIRLHFGMPHPTKSFEDLKKIYEEAREDRLRDGALWAFAKARHTAAVDLIVDLINAGKWIPHSRAIAEYERALKSSSVANALLNRLSARLDAPNEHAYRDALTAIAEGADAGSTDVLRGFLNVEKPQELTQLLPFFVRHPDPKAVALYAQYVGERYDSVPFDLTLGLAAMGDPGVLSWALDPAKIAANKTWLSAHVIAVSPLPRAETAAQELVKTGAPELVKSLLQGYGHSRSPQRVARILDCLAQRGKDPNLAREVRELLSRLAREGDGDATEAYKQTFPPSPAPEK